MKSICIFTFCFISCPALSGGELEIHYINVGQGTSILLIGPNGTSVLYDFGGNENAQDILRYLNAETILHIEKEIDYAILSHRDSDHLGGYKRIIESGYDIKIANYDSGSKKLSNRIGTGWLQPAQSSSAGRVIPFPLGHTIDLGDEAKLHFIAGNGKIYPNRRIDVNNENDRSIVILISYKNFQYILDGDLGDGKEGCTGHKTRQTKMQSLVAKSLFRLGLLHREFGVDVMHVAHHGADSGTTARYVNRIKPDIALLSVGRHKNRYCHPRVNVVDKVLLNTQRARCATAAPVELLLQTEEGNNRNCDVGLTSFSGRPLGDIKLSTDGSRIQITATQRVHAGTVVKKCTKKEPCITLTDELKK